MLGPQIIEGRVNRQVEIGPGVTIGHREDVERVKLTATSSEGRPSDDCPSPNGRGINFNKHVRRVMEVTDKAPDPRPAGRFGAIPRLGYP